MLEVKFWGGAEDEVKSLGSIVYVNGKLYPWADDPKQLSYLRWVIENPISVFLNKAEGIKTFKPDKDPEGWIRNLYLEYRSPYAHADPALALTDEGLPLTTQGE